MGKYRHSIKSAGCSKKLIHALAPAVIATLCLEDKMKVDLLICQDVFLASAVLTGTS